MMKPAPAAESCRKGVTYRITSGDSAKISADGLITPDYTYWKRNGQFSQSVPEGEDYDYYTLSAGDTEIMATTAEHSYTVIVHVENYAIVYGDEVMDAYLSENVKKNMTDLEIMKAVARFPAGYDYSASCSDVYSMIIYGGGDCWASTSAIIALCDKLGIKAWSRNGNKDPGAGGGHVNAMAELNGTYYELEAGYSMSKGEDGYRPYDVTERESLFSYYSYASSDGLVIYQYDGYNITGTLEIPETIHGRPVTGIDKNAFGKSGFSEFKLPDTLTTIGDFAFGSCSNLTHIEIPASVTSLGSSVFVSCDKLKDISVASNSKSYQEIDQAIYTKDGATLVTCPRASEVTIPNTVKKIADYAFYYNKNLHQITIPESVTEIGEGSFGNCSNLSKITIEGSGLTAIGRHCFRDNSALSVIRIPESVRTLGTLAFAYCSKLKHIYFRGDAPAFGEMINGEFYDKVFDGCKADAYYPEGNATWTEDKLTGHDGTITWSTWTGGEAVSLEDAEIFMEQDSYTFTGEEITPDVVVTAGGQTLALNKDYIVNYTDNTNAGTAMATVVGVGLYKGEISKNFTITKAKQEVKAYVDKTSILEGETTEIFCISLYGDYTYTSDRPSVATVNADGVISGISAGTAVITVQVAESENYLAASTQIEITVTKDGTDEGKKDENPQPGEETKPGEGANKKITLSGISNKIAAGKKLQLVAVVQPGNAANKQVTWTTSNPKVATVDANGLVKVRKKTGGKQVTITATATDGSGVSASYTIKSMKGAVKSVKISGKKTVKAGKSLKLKGTVKTTKGAANKKLLWKSGNPRVATVSASGKVKTFKGVKGKVKITAMATDGSGKKKTITLKVK